MSTHRQEALRALDSANGESDAGAFYRTSAIVHALLDVGDRIDKLIDRMAR